MQMLSLAGPGTFSSGLCIPLIRKQSNPRLRITGPAALAGMGPRPVDAASRVAGRTALLSCLPGPARGRTMSRLRLSDLSLRAGLMAPRARPQHRIHESSGWRPPRAQSGAPLVQQRGTPPVRRRRRRATVTGEGPPAEVAERLERVPGRSRRRVPTRQPHRRGGRICSAVRVRLATESVSRPGPFPPSLFRVVRRALLVHAVRA